MAKETDSYPPKGPLDVLSRVSDLLIENIKATRALASVIPGNIELQQRLQSAEQVPYEIVGGEGGLDLTAARSDVEFKISGSQLVANSDGTLEGVTIRFNNPIAPPMPIKFFNPWTQPFFKIYLTHTAQSGKKLYLMALRGAANAGSAAQTLGMYLQPEWAARTGVDKNFYAAGAGAGISAIIAYTVPSGKTLYLTQFSCASILTADPVIFRIWEITTSEILWAQGGYGGLGLSLNKPIPIPSAHQVQIEAGSIGLNLVSAGGYEV